MSEDLARHDTYGALFCFGSVFEQLHKLSPVAIDDEKLIASGVSAMTTGLDSRSSYIDAQGFRDLQVLPNSNMGGIGVEIALKYGRIEVISTIGNSSATRAGIQARDIISQIDGQSVQGITIEGAIRKLRGPLGSKVNLRIIRKDQPIELTIPREIVVVHSVTGHAMQDVGYIRITHFNEQTMDNLKEAIADISKRVAPDQLKGYIIDMRNNPGGLLDQAISVSDAFLNQGEIVSTRGRDPAEAQRFIANSGDLAKGKPIIVLINGGSAAASEIVAGALQDHKRATLVGTKSFGLGTIQTIIPLGAGNGALRLTTARYYLPSGRWIAATGVTPDIEVVQNASDEGRSSADSDIPSDQKRDSALQMAIELLRGSVHNTSFPPNPKTLRP